MRQNNHFPSFFVGKKKKIKKRRASIVVKTSASNDRPLLALASDKVEREDGLCLRRFKDNRDNSDNFFSLLVLLACKRPRPLLAEVLKTIETIGTIFFLACK